MKTTLLPLALLALSLPSAALAYPLPAPTKTVYRTVVTSAAPGRAVGYQAYGSPYPAPGYAMTPPPVVTPVVRYGVAAPYGYGAPSGYGYPAAPAYSYAPPVPYGMAPAPVVAANRCGPGTGRVLVGAALGGLASAALAPRARDRAWAVPVGAALGGLGGLATSRC